MIISASGVSTSSYPFVGYDNVVTTMNISASTSDASYPASNAANPALNLRWQGASAADQYLQVTGTGTIDYVGIAGHNFFSQNIAVSLSAYGYGDFFQKSLLHLDANLIDETGKTWTASGNAAITTAASKFGRGSLALDGTGDWIDTPDSADFDLTSGDFTVDIWVKVNVDGTALNIAGQVDAGGGTNSNTAWYIARTSGNLIQGLVTQSTTQTGVQSTTTLTIASGWMHIAFVRTGNVLKLFINGTQEGGNIAFTGSVNGSSAKLGLGSRGNETSNPWNGWIDEFRFSVGIARWTANFTPPTAPYNMQIVDAYSLTANDKSVLRFDGPNNSTSFIDLVGNTWTAHGNAKIDSLQRGGYFDGTGDYIDTPDRPAFALGTSDFTIEFWFNCQAATNAQAYICGQNDAGIGVATSSFYMVRTANNVIQVGWSNGSVLRAIVGTTSFTSTSGWAHAAFVRSGNTFKLYINGVSEGTPLTVADTIPDSASVLAIGAAGALTSPSWNGWIDDFRLSVGTALYTGNFTPTPRETSSRVPPDDGPLIFRFPPIDASRIQLVMRAGDVAPQVAAIYAGTLLVMERSISIEVTHTPINMGRMSKVTNGRAESGKFTGRIVLGRWNAGSIDFRWFTPTWYRAYFDPFLVAAIEAPFFIAWNPVEYPLEVGYVAITEDVRPEVDTVTRRVAVKMDFQGEAA